MAEAHRAEVEAAARSGTPGPQQPGGTTPPIPIAPGGASLSAPGSLGAPTPPAPASPAHSHASAAAAVLGGGPGRSLSGARAASEASGGGGASDDDFPLDVEEAGQGGAKAPIGARRRAWFAPSGARRVSMGGSPSAYLPCPPAPPTVRRSQPAPRSPLLLPPQTRRP